MAFLLHECTDPPTPPEPHPTTCPHELTTTKPQQGRSRLPQCKAPANRASNPSALPSCCTMQYTGAWDQWGHAHCKLKQAQTTLTQQAQDTHIPHWCRGQLQTDAQDSRPARETGPHSTKPPRKWLTGWQRQSEPWPLPSSNLARTHTHSHDHAAATRTDIYSRQ